MRDTFMERILFTFGLWKERRGKIAAKKISHDDENLLI